MRHIRTFYITLAELSEHAAALGHPTHDPNLQPSFEEIIKQLFAADWTFLRSSFDGAGYEVEVIADTF